MFFEIFFIDFKRAEEKKSMAIYRIYLYFSKLFALGTHWVHLVPIGSTQTNTETFLKF